MMLCDDSVVQKQPLLDSDNVSICSSNDADKKPATYEEDQRSHTFRKRRLTYTRHHIEDAAVSFDDSSSDDAPVMEGEIAHNEKDDEEAEKETAKNKRKPLKRKAGKDDDDDPESEVSAGEQVEAPKKRKKADAPEKTSKQKKRQLESRTMHASPPPRQSRSTSSAANKFTSPLYHHHPNGHPADQAYTHLPHDQPAWKMRRQMLHSIDEDETLLPFPRHVVGTYSCHGVEPLYDSDYDYTAQEEKDSKLATENILNNVLEHDDDDDDEEEEEEEKKVKEKVVRRASESSVASSTSIAPPSTVAKINQDRGGVAFPYGNSPRTALFAAYDGHGDGGEMVAQFALHEVQRRLEIHPDFENDIETAFRDTFVEVDEALKDEQDIEPLHSGCTACVVLMRDKTVTVSNAGDSRAVMATRVTIEHDNEESDTSTLSIKTRLEAVNLSTDQNPDTPGEQERIETMGGFVSPPPEEGLSARVWLDIHCTQIGLAMARSIGDHAVKPVGVIADPVVTTHHLQENNEFLIIATDGVWEFISSQEAVDIVAKHLDKGSSKACQLLIEAAAAKWHEHEGDYRDDITALVILVKELWSGHAP